MRCRFLSRSATGLAASFIVLGIAASPAGASGTRSIEVEVGADEAAQRDSVTVTGSSFRVNSSN